MLGLIAALVPAVVVPAGIFLVLAFGLWRGGRTLRCVGWLLGGAFVGYIVLIATVLIAWELLVGDGPCPMGLCSGSPRKPPPATSATTIDGHWIGYRGRTGYILDLAQSGASVIGTGKRGNAEAWAPLTVSGSAAPGDVQLDFGSVIFSGAFADEDTLRGRVQGAEGDDVAGDDETLELHRHGPSQAK